MEWRVRRRHSVALILVFTVIRPQRIRACARIQATIGRHRTRAVRRFLSKRYFIILFLCGLIPGIEFLEKNVALVMG